jgi:protein-S-isoprenylcysteine O-methyltransferase Ste14
VNVFGIGPRIAIGGVISFVATWQIGMRLGCFDYWFVPTVVKITFGTALLAAGLYFWVDGVRLIVTGFKSGNLITEGVYRFVRNPIYSSFIVFIIPSISLLLNNALIILSSIVMMLVFKMNIYKEEQYLKQKFGVAYENYVTKVKQIVPFVW